MFLDCNQVKAFQRYRDEENAQLSYRALVMEWVYFFWNAINTPISTFSEIYVHLYRKVYVPVVRRFVLQAWLMKPSFFVTLARTTIYNNYISSISTSKAHATIHRKSRALLAKSRHARSLLKNLSHHLATAKIK